MAGTKTVYYMTARDYRGLPGWHVGSRGGGGWPISIWVPTEDQATRIRDLLRAAGSTSGADPVWAVVDAIISERDAQGKWTPRDTK